MKFENINILEISNECSKIQLLSNALGMKNLIDYLISILKSVKIKNQKQEERLNQIILSLEQGGSSLNYIPSKKRIENFGLKFFRWKFDDERNKKDKNNSIWIKKIYF